MNIKEKHCIFCMERLEPDQENCPACGKTSWEYEWRKSWLRPQTLLHKRYLCGTVLGQGANGITYLGFDMVLSQKVAVKEFFVQRLAVRTEKDQETVPITEKETEVFEKEKRAFIKEAALLAGKFDVPGICAVRDYFEENGTAYIVEEYLPGKTLKEYLEKHPHHRLDAGELNLMFLPVFRGLAQLHSEGILHCDISPDNLMFDGRQTLRLIDFGAACQGMQAGADAVLKEGYAPPEQYQNGGLLGPWTDIYALCAVLYQALGGKKPMPAPIRLKTDSMEELSDLAPAAGHIARVVMQGLTLDIRKRYFCIANLMEGMQMKTDDVKVLLGATRAKWGDIWLSATAEQAGDFQRRKKRLLTGRLLRRTAVTLAVLCGAAVLVAGLLCGYVKTHPKQVFAWRIERAQAYEQKHPDCRNIDRNSPEYSALLQFAKKHAVKDENDFYTAYEISKQDVLEKKLVSNGECKFYLDKNTLRQMVDYYLDTDLEQKYGEQITNYSGSVQVDRGKLGKMRIWCAETATYGFDSRGAEAQLKVRYDVTDERISKVQLTAMEEDCRIMLRRVLPCLVPETYLTDEEIEDILTEAEETLDDSDTVSLRDHARYQLSVSKKRVSEFEEDQGIFTVTIESGSGMDIFW